MPESALEAFGYGYKKAAAPHRRAERILEVTLELFNRFGEPNVSTTLIAAELTQALFKR